MEIIDVSIDGKTLKDVLVEMARVNIEKYSDLCDQAGTIVERHTSLLIVPQVGTAFHLVLVAIPIPEHEAEKPNDIDKDGDWPTFIDPDFINSSKGQNG